MIKSAFVLAGGFGTRLSPLVTDVPKPLARVAGRPFLAYLLDYLVDAAVGEIILCVGHKAEMIVETFGSVYRGCPIHYSYETTALGTGGALSQALSHFPRDDFFLVVNGDTYFPIPLDELLEIPASRSWAWKMALFFANDFSRYTRVSLKSDEVVSGIEEVPKRLRGIHSGEFRANAGILLGNPDNLRLPLMEVQPPYSFERYLTSLLTMKSPSLLGRAFTENFIDIGLPADYLLAQSMPEFLGR